MKNNYKKIIISLVGVLALGLGLGLTSLANLGSDSLASFDIALARILNRTYGEINTIVSVLMVIIAFFLSKKNIGLATLLSALLCKYPIDFINSSFQNSSNMFINILILLSGTLLTAFGAQLIIISDMGMATYEAFVYSLVNRLNIKFLYVKYSCDAFFMICAIILKAPIGIGTIISYCLTGLLMNKLDKPLRRIILSE